MFVRCTVSCPNCPFFGLEDMASTKSLEVFYFPSTSSYLCLSRERIGCQWGCNQSIMRPRSSIAKILRAYMLCFVALVLCTPDSGDSSNWLGLPVINHTLLMAFSGGITVFVLALLMFSIHVTEANISRTDTIDGSPLLDSETSGQLISTPASIVQKILFWFLIMSPIPIQFG